MSDSGWNFYWFDPSTTDVDIANMALAEIGGGQITDLSDKDDISLPKMFNQTREELLARFPWAFGKGRKLIYPSPIELANSLKVLMNEHAADTAMHTTADTTNFPVTTDDATDLDTLYVLVGDLLTAYDGHDSDAELGSGWAFHRAQEMTDYSLSSTTPPTTQEEAVERLNELRSYFNSHDTDNVSHTTYSQHEETKEECGMPDFEYTYEYYLPSDYLGGAELYDSDSSFLIEGNRILTDDPYLNLKYRKRATNATTYSRLFTQCLVLSLASKMAMAIAQDKTLARELNNQVEIVFRNATSTDAYEGKEDTTREDTTWQSH